MQIIPTGPCSHGAATVQPRCIPHANDTSAHPSLISMAGPVLCFCDRPIRDPAHGENVGLLASFVPSREFMKQALLSAQWRDCFPAHAFLEVVLDLIGRSS